MCSWHCFTEKLKRFSAPMLTTLKSPEDNSSVQRWWCSNGYQSMSRFHNDSVSCSHRCRWIRLRRIRSRTCIGNCRHCCRRSRAYRNLRCSRCIRWYLQPCNKKLRRAWLVLGLVTTFGGSTIAVFIQATQAHVPGHPLWVVTMSTRDRFGHMWEKKLCLQSYLTALYTCKSVYKYK